MDSNDYLGKEQAYVKHYVLSQYLERLAFKIGGFRSGTTLNYIDGFSGPWNADPENPKDSSPHVALTALGNARRTLAALPSPKQLHLRAMFVEKTRKAFKQLGELCSRFSDIETACRNGEFEAFIVEAEKFAKEGSQPFAFTFIDPTGWTGYGMKAITPMLKIQLGEVLINFMTKDIIRFINDEESTAMPSFIDLFGDAKFRDEWRGLQGLDREDAIVRAYCERVKKAGGFAHVVSTVVFHPSADRTHYHLVYATRSLTGLVVFRETEAKALPEQKRVRAETKRRKTARSQPALFGSEILDAGHIDRTTKLQQRYRPLATAHLERILQLGKAVAYDVLVAETLNFPMFSEKELKAWISQHAKELELINLSDGERVPKPKKKHQVRWKKDLGT